MLTAPSSLITKSESITLLDWQEREWTFNYTIELIDNKHNLNKISVWAVTWEVINPDGRQHSKAYKPDIALAYRCMNENGLVDKLLLRQEFNWWLTHYNNVVVLPRKVLPKSKS